MSARTVVVLGGGVGGVVAAHRLRRRLPRRDRVVLVDRSPVQVYAPSLLWVLTGARRPDRLSRPLDRLRRHGIQVDRVEVTGIDTAEQAVHSAAGVLRYDRLVVALGAELAPELTPGIEAAHDLYTSEGATAARDALQRIDRGRVLVSVAGAPYRCPAAPWEAALLARSVLRRRGVAARTSVTVTTPEPQPMPVAGPEMGAAVLGMLEERGVAARLEHQLDLIDPAERTLHFAGREPVTYDLLLVVPAHRPPEVVRTSGLAGPSGYIPVDPATLAATAADGVYAIGDVSAVPIPGGKVLPKAGVFAHAEAEVVADRIADELAGRAPTATFDGRGACFVEVGDGRAAYATGDFYAEGGPALRLHPPSRRWHLTKVAFERYWLTRWWW